MENNIPQDNGTHLQHLKTQCEVLQYEKVNIEQKYRQLECEHNELKQRHHNVSERLLQILNKLKTSFPS